MEENYDDITKSFTEKIESYEMPVSDRVWESLDNKLDKEAANKYKAMVFRLRLMVASLIFLIGSFGLYFFLTTNSKYNEQETSKKGAFVPVVSDSRSNSVLLASNNLNDILKAEKIKSTKNDLNNSGNTKSTSIKATVKENIIQPTENKKVNSARHNKVTAITKLIENSLTESNKSSVQISKKTTDHLLPAKGTIVSNSIPRDSTLQVEPINSVTSISDIKDDTLQSAISKTANSDSALACVIIPDLKPKNKFINRISFIGYFSPDFTNKYLVDPNKNDNQTQSEYEGKETSDFSFNTGILIGCDLTQKWTIRAGVAYTYLMQSIKPKTVYSREGIDGQQHYQFNTSYGTAQIPNDASPSPQLGDSLRINSTSTQLLQMISVPLIAKYQIQKNKFAYYAQFGLSMNFLVGEKLLVETPNKLETITNIEGLKEFNFGGIVGCGVSYSPIKKFSIMLEPTFRGFLSPINKNSSIKTYPYSFGISLGLGWHL